MLKKLLIVVGLGLLTACGSSHNVQRNEPAETRDDAQLTSFIGTLKTNKPQEYSLIMDKRLSEIYREWSGTRYRLGGLSKLGIDCSGFTQTAFAKAFGIELPRSTSEQQYLGRKIGKADLKSGDLVFFRSNRHVGIYIGNNQFMHASTKNGVTISSLDESYWSRTYTQSRRIL
ncbi:NlpC/P60 family protein [Caviibacterium pharyngocola]|uniref:NlpC/P60 domain-containing protein n=1 Tax=Caviibacterium pharyngocola TaxID=28159 RepID=A0A2M8RYP6_9PAST|nr:NlpC/P60 family protein [Caviibacterium pharyngocola]PJG84002.1 hypothetical protein CVP04_00670 [Caviibacterium pharyngocola]